MGAHKAPELSITVCRNLKRVAEHFDLSSRDIATRADMPQATVYKVLEGQHNPNVSTLAKLCDALLVDPATVTMARISTGTLVSRRVPRLFGKLESLTPDQRQAVEGFIDHLLLPKEGAQ